MRIETLMISLFLFAFGAVGCSQPEPVKAEYEPADCNCAEQATTAEKSTADETPPAKTEALAAKTSADQAAQPDEGPASADEVAVAAPADEAEESSEEEKTAQKGDPNGVVNLNTASLDQLMALPGVGPSLAARIVEFRQQRRFEEVKHLLRVKGIGQAKFSKLQPMVTVSGETTLVKK